MSGQEHMPLTVLKELYRALQRAAEYNPQDQSMPAVVLWKDEERHWEPLVPRLRKDLPQLLTLGPYAPGERTGPAIWIRCMIDRVLPAADWPKDAVPILYLPGVSWLGLRAVENCPRELQPLTELQYRGVWFTQENTRDWTIRAFLTSRRGGLGLEVASDGDTREAMLQALPKLADTPLAELRGRRLHAADFRALLQPDLIRGLLRWLDNPESTRNGWTVDEWQAFCGGCRKQYGFDPEKDGPLVGAEELGARQGTWDAVWVRFGDAPLAYPKLPELLRRAKPKGEHNLLFRPECWPQCNERAEGELRAALARLLERAPEAAAAQLEKLESSHSGRRGWVWAKLGHAPLAQALEHLALLARATRTKLGGESATAMAETYATDGWRADAAVLDALASVARADDGEAVTTAIRAVYKPWLEAAAERFQELIRLGFIGDRESSPAGPSETGPGTCIVFADGLRLDVGKRLRSKLEPVGCVVQETWVWVPVPPVTPTAKPAVSPVADLLTGRDADVEEVRPVVCQTGQSLTPELFRRLLNECGFQWLAAKETGDPAGRGWTEHGDIDRRGHEEGWKLARRIDEELAGLLDRVRALLDAGWKEIRIVTDHGWLLLPGGLPKVDMPLYLVESRWARCGALKPGASPEVPTAPWHWNPEVQVALAPGIACFRDGIDYSHGSLTVQECIVPSFAVRSAHSRGPGATVESVRWTRLRCRVRVTGAGTGWHVDLRTRAADPASSLAKDGRPRAIGPDGQASLVVDDPDKEGVAATVVLLDAEGRVVARKNTTVAGEE